VCTVHTVIYKAKYGSFLTQTCISGGSRECSSCRTRVPFGSSRSCGSGFTGGSRVPGWPGATRSSCSSLWTSRT